MPLPRRRLLKTLAATAAAIPLAATLPAQTPAAADIPTGVQAFLADIKAALRSGAPSLDALLAGADSDLATATLFSNAVFSEASPLVFIRESVHLVTPIVATIDAEIGRFHTVGGWEGRSVWIVLERRGRGAFETWKPVLVRTSAPSVSFLNIPLRTIPRTQLL